MVSLVAGLVMCVIYDITRVLRWHLSLGRAGVFFLDILYFSVSGIATFCLFLSLTNGEIRGYILIGEAVGFMLFRATLSVFFCKGLKVFLKVLNFALNLANKWIFVPLKSFFAKTITVFKKIAFKMPLFKKKGLKNDDGLVYTK